MYGCIWEDHEQYMQENGPNLIDEQLDRLVRFVQARTPHIGYRMMKGILQAMGHWV